MPHHEERAPSTLAHGPAKPNDIERVRREVGSVKTAQTGPPVERKLHEVEAKCDALQHDLGEIKRTIEAERTSDARKVTKRSGR
jgi:hypothetical protein